MRIKMADGCAHNLSAVQTNSTLARLRSIFSHAQVAGKNDFIFFASADANSVKLLFSFLFSSFFS